MNEYTVEKATHPCLDPGSLCRAPVDAYSCLTGLHGLEHMFYHFENQHSATYLEDIKTKGWQRSISGRDAFKLGAVMLFLGSYRVMRTDQRKQYLNGMHHVLYKDKHLILTKPPAPL